jgi:hypothetical protein
MGGWRTSTQNVNNDEQKQPNDIDKVPIPSGGLKAEMLFRGELSVQRAQ